MLLPSRLPNGLGTGYAPLGVYLRQTRKRVGELSEDDSEEIPPFYPMERFRCERRSRTWCNKTQRKPRSTPRGYSRNPAGVLANAPG